MMKASLLLHGQMTADAVLVSSDLLFHGVVVQLLQNKRQSWMHACPIPLLTSNDVLECRGKQHKCCAPDLFAALLQLIQVSAAVHVYVCTASDGQPLGHVAQHACGSSLPYLLGWWDDVNVR